jgi:hypothetical protein
MAGLVVPAIHVLSFMSAARRGCPGNKPGHDELSRASNVPFSLNIRSEISRVSLGTFRHV